MVLGFNADTFVIFIGYLYVLLKYSINHLYLFSLLICIFSHFYFVTK